MNASITVVVLVVVAFAVGGVGLAVAMGKWLAHRNGPRPTPGGDDAP